MNASEIHAVRRRHEARRRIGAATAWSGAAGGLLAALFGVLFAQVQPVAGSTEAGSTEAGSTEAEATEAGAAPPPTAVPQASHRPSPARHHTAAPAAPVAPPRPAPSVVRPHVATGAS